MISYDDAIKLVGVLNRTRSDDHMMPPDDLTRNLNHSLGTTEFRFVFDGFYGYKVEHYASTPDIEISNG